MTIQSANTPSSIDNLIELGNKIYDQIQKEEKIEEKFKGQYIAIDVKSERYFIKESRDEAMQAGKSELPDVVFYVKRIGGIDTISSQYPFFIKNQLTHARIF
jgi:hypothetical protein